MNENTLNRLNFYLGSQKENTKNFLNLVNSGKFKPMVAYHLDKSSIYTPKQTRDIHKNPSLNSQLKNIQGILKDEERR